jgi:hypothetical protein
MHANFYSENLKKETTLVDLDVNLIEDNIVTCISDQRRGWIGASIYWMLTSRNEN